MREDVLNTIKVIAKDLKKICEMTECKECPFADVSGCRINGPRGWRLKDEKNS